MAAPPLRAIVPQPPGGNSVIGLEACAQAVPDGSTFCAVNIEAMAMMPHSEPELYQRVRPLAVLGARRLPELPDTPSMVELGYHFPYGGAWWGLAAPPGTTRAVLERMAGAVRAVVTNEAFRSRVLAPQFFDPIGNTPAGSAAVIAREWAGGAELVRLAGIAPDDDNAFPGTGYRKRDRGRPPSNRKSAGSAAQKGKSGMDTLSRRGLRGLLGAAIGALFLSAPAAAQRADAAWPTRPVRIIVPQPPGGVLDTLVRSLGESLRAQLEQTIVVENRPGGNNVIGLEACATAAPDGYTFCGVSIEVMSTYPYVQPTLFARYASLQPVTQIATSPGVLLAATSVPPGNLSDFVRWAKGRSGLNYSSSGEGSSQHLLWEWIKARDGIAMEHVPFRGVSEAISELGAGRIQASYVALGFALPQIQAGRMRPLAVLGSARVPQLPDTPSLGELGYDFPYTGAWWGIAAPHGTPAPLLDRMAKAVHAVVADPAYRERVLAPQAYQGVGNSPAEFAAIIEEERRRGADMVRLSGVRPPVQ
jgi:tripartite-type tricarboxylate transporter receptor subunit TctC